MTESVRPLARPLPLVAGIVLVLVLLALYETPAVALFRYTAYLGLVVVAPGMLVWRWLMRRYNERLRTGGFSTSLEDLVCGAAVGYVMEIASYAAARAVGVPRLYLVVPLVVLVVGGVGELRSAKSPRQGIGTWPSLALVGLVGYLTVHLCQTVLMHLSVPFDGVFYEPDEMFHLALVGELRHHFPAVYPYLSDEKLNYQYFSHLHMAASTWATGLEPELLYRRFDPVVMAILATLGPAVVAMRLTLRVWPGLVASAVLVVVGAFDVSGTIAGQAVVEERFLVPEVLVHSPTQAFAFVLASPLALLGAHIVARNAAPTWGVWSLFGVLVLGMAGAKVTFLPMFAVGFLAVAVLRLLLDRSGWAPAVIAFSSTCVVIWLSAVVLYGGQSRDLTWDPLAIGRYFAPSFGQGGRGTDIAILTTLTLVVGWLVPAAGAIGLFRRHATRTDPRMWFLLATVVAGFGAAILLGHPANSQRYFERSAAVPAAVLCAWGLSELFPSGTTRRRAWHAVWLAGTAGALLLFMRLGTEALADMLSEKPSPTRRPGVPVAFNLVLVGVGVVGAWVVAVVLRHRGRRLALDLVIAFVVGLGLARTFAFVIGDQPPHETTPLVVPQDGRTAMDYLRDHAGPNDLILTNAHCGPVMATRPCDSRHFWMSALSERRLKIEGWAYAPASEWLSGYPGDPRKLAANDTVFTRPETAAAALPEGRVIWLVVDSTAANQEVSTIAGALGADIILEGRQIALLRLTGEE